MTWDKGLCSKWFCSSYLFGFLEQTCSSIHDFYRTNVCFFSTPVEFESNCGTHRKTAFKRSLKTHKKCKTQKRVILWFLAPQHAVVGQQLFFVLVDVRHPHKVVGQLQDRPQHEHVLIYYVAKWQMRVWGANEFNDKKNSHRFLEQKRPSIFYRVQVDAPVPPEECDPGQVWQKAGVGIPPRGGISVSKNQRKLGESICKKTPIFHVAKSLFPLPELRPPKPLQGRAEEDGGADERLQFFLRNNARNSKLFIPFFFEPWLAHCWGAKTVVQRRLLARFLLPHRHRPGCKHTVGEKNVCLACN